jgi:phosphonoacetate hydrolase
MPSRRYILLGSVAAAVGCRSRRPAARKVLIVLVDGFGPEYFDKSDMPNLRRLAGRGGYKVAQTVIPSVTNVNNASLVTGSFPKDHGITTNFHFDRETGKSFMMESSEFLLRPTIFERANKLGWRTALVTSKDKVRTLCARGADLQVSAERPEARFLEIAGKKENMYSPNVNYWTFRAARHILKNESVDLVYLSTTDYMMHTHAPEEEASLRHMHTLDRLLGGIVDDHPRIEVYLTADHGMNAKHEALDPSLVLKRKSMAAEAVPIIRDKHQVHHQNLGGACYVYLERSRDLAKAMDVLKQTAGVEEVFDSQTAADRFQLHPKRIGDIFLLAAKDVAFGNLQQVREPAKVRSHGSRHEAQVPLVVFNGKLDMTEYEYNLDLTRNLALERV